MSQDSVCWVNLRWVLRTKKVVCATLRLVFHHEGLPSYFQVSVKSRDCLLNYSWMSVKKFVRWVKWNCSCYWNTTVCCSRRDYFVHNRSFECNTGHSAYPRPVLVVQYRNIALRWRSKKKFRLTDRILFISSMFHNVIFNLSLYVHIGAASLVSGPSKSYWNIFRTFFGMKSYSPLSLITHNRAVCGYHLGELNNDKLKRSAVKEILQLYEQGKVKPMIDSVWSYSDVSARTLRVVISIN